MTLTPYRNNVHPDDHCHPMTIQFDHINEPGCYVCNWSGHLLRVPPDGIAPGRSPLMNFVGRKALFVTKIGNDPYMAVTKARLLAANAYLDIHF
jgi:hypothetical protein